MTTIYVALLNEGTPVWRPVAAEHVGGDVFFIPLNAPHDTEDEEWEFSAGDRVRCETRRLSDLEVLVAVERVPTAA